MNCITSMNFQCLMSQNTTLPSNNINLATSSYQLDVSLRHPLVLYINAYSIRTKNCAILFRNGGSICFCIVATLLGAAKQFSINVILGVIQLLLYYYMNQKCYCRWTMELLKPLTEIAVSNKVM